MKTNHRAAFTLVELLVVCAVIAILISMLLPAAARAKHHAKVVVCQSNMRQIGMMYLLYETDTKLFPRRSTSAVGDTANADTIPGAGGTGGTEVLAYLPNKKAFYCPGRDEFAVNWRRETNNWPTAGYFFWGGDLFPDGLRSRFPLYPVTTPVNWLNAYYPLAQDVMWGFTSTDRTNGIIDDASRRVAHAVLGKMTQSQAVRHDGSVSSETYFSARQIGSPSTLVYSFAGSVNWGSSKMWVAVDPVPFAPQSGPAGYRP